jgi:hypothetical protein
MATAKRKQEEAEGLADGDGSDRDDEDLGVRGNAAKRLRRELQEEELARQWDIVLWVMRRKNWNNREIKISEI